MRYLLTALALLTIAAYAVLPLQAEASSVVATGSMGACTMDGMSCDSMDMTTIQSLRDCVEHAYQMGSITNQGVEASLLKLVGAAQKAADRGNTSAAIGSLNAFIALVKAQSGLTIDPAHADCLIMHAAAVVSALGG